MKNFTPSAPIMTPPEAQAMYARDFKPIEWSQGLDREIIATYRDLKAVWQHKPGRDGIWNNPQPFIAKPIRGKPYEALRGQCNDFAPKLRNELAQKGLDPDAMRLVVCNIVPRRGGHSQPHMVLAILTTEGTQICCNLRGCWALMSPEWDNEKIVYEWHMMEGPGRSGWFDLRQHSLGDLPAVREMI